MKGLVVHEHSMMLQYIRRQEERVRTPRKSKVFTFFMPPKMAEQVHQVVRKESCTVSEFLREAIRLYMDGRKRRSLP